MERECFETPFPEIPVPMSAEAAHTVIGEAIVLDRRKTLCGLRQGGWIESVR